MRGQADTRLKKTTVGMLRKGCCCEMGRWGYAKRKEFHGEGPGRTASAQLDEAQARGPLVEGLAAWNAPEDG
eukprot:2106746-Pyramimonas_sp.AAC.1